MRKLFPLLAVLAFLAYISSAGAVAGGANVTRSVEIAAKVMPSPVSPGGEGYMELTLTNTGTEPINNVWIKSWEADQAIAQKSLTTGSSSLNPGESASFLFKFSIPSTARPGFYTVSFIFEVWFGNECRDYKKDVVITVDAPFVLELTSVEPASLRRGEKVSLSFTLTNTADWPLNNIIFSWQSPNNLMVPIGSDNRILIPEMKAHESRKILWTVAVDSSASPGVYPVLINMSYVDQVGSQKGVSTTVGITVEGSTDFDVSLESIEGSSARLSIANVGQNTAYSVIVGIPQQESFRVIGASKAVLGNLNPGDYTLATFQIIPIPGRMNVTGARAVRNLVVEVSYTDVLGSRNTLRKEIELSLAGVESNLTEIGGRRIATRPTEGQLQMSGLMYMAVGIAGIIAIAVLFKLAKRRR